MYKLFFAICFFIVISLFCQSCSNIESGKLEEPTKLLELSDEDLENIGNSLGDFIFNRPDSEFRSIPGLDQKVYDLNIERSFSDTNIFCISVIMKTSSEKYGVHYFYRPYFVKRESNFWGVGKMFEQDWQRDSCPGEYIYMSNLTSPLQ